MVKSFAGKHAKSNFVRGKIKINSAWGKFYPVPCNKNFSLLERWKRIVYTKQPDSQSEKRKLQATTYNVYKGE